MSKINFFWHTLWNLLNKHYQYKTPSNLTRIMKKIIITLTFFTTSLLFNFIPVRAFDNNEVNLKPEEALIREACDAVFTKIELKVKNDKNTIYAIYNYKNELVYQTKDKEDERFKQLLRRCDLVLKTESSSYYLLGK